MAGRQKPILIRLETQGRLTLALLPLVAALPFLDDEVIARIFGQTMALLNWAQATTSAFELPPVLRLPESQIARPYRRTKQDRAQTKAKQRAYWREKKREERQRKAQRTKEQQP